MARVSKQWAAMTPEQKAPYERLQAEAKQKWEVEKRAYDERRGIVAPAKPAGRKSGAVAVEEPVDLATAGPPGTKLARNPPESSDSSIDTSSSDKSEGEEDGASGNSGEDEEDNVEEELPVPSPPPAKNKAKRKAESATATTTPKPKSMVSSSAAPMPARQEKKKRSKV